MFRAAVAAVCALAFLTPSVAAADTLHMAPNGSGTACTTLAPCGTLQAAYQAARLGDTVELAAGFYGDQTIPASVSKGQPDTDLPDVHFQPALGAVVRFAAMRFYAPHIRVTGVEVNGMLTARYRVENPAVEASGDVHFDRMRVVNGGRIMLTGVKGCSVTNSEIANGWRDGIDLYGTSTGAGDAGHYLEDCLIEGNHIHDLRLIDDDHIDGIQFTTGVNVVIRGNEIGPRIHHQGLLAKTDRGPVTGVRVEGNVFHDVIEPGFSLMFHRWSGRRCDDIAVVGNDFRRAPTPRNGPDDQCSGVMSGNTISSMSSFACQQWLESFTLTGNRFVSGEPCDSATPAPEPTPTPTPTPDPDAPPVVADWSYTPDRPVIREPVTLDGTTSQPADVTCRWDFDGFQQRNGCLIDFTFQGAGEKRITLTVTAPDGRQAAAAKTIVVNEPPAPSPTPTPTPEPTPEPPYEPACAPTCDEQITDLTDRLTRIRAILNE